MKLYYTVQNNSIVDVTDMENSDLEVSEFNLIDEFLQDISQKNYSIDQETQRSVEDLLSEIEYEDDIFEYNLKTATSNRSFGELADMFEHDEIIIPDMQRKFIWKTTQCSKLIESILMGLPIPPLFFMELDDGRYEVIDGLQRLTTITNFIEGRPWGFKLNQTQRKVTAKLTGSIDKSIKGKTFEDLTDSQKRKIKRTTVTVIDFRQISPENNDAKYLIFERINTGSEALNPMQIRKSLAHGSFMKSMYASADNIGELKNLYTKNSVNKDLHVEAFLRTYVMSQFYYNNYAPRRQGIKYMLDDYCEENKNEIFDDEFSTKFSTKLENLKNVFGTNLFKRVKNGQFTGNMSTSILEAMLGVLIYNDEVEIDKTMIDSYKKLIEIKDEDDPFLSSTGTFSSVKKRFKICEDVILRKSVK